MLARSNSPYNRYILVGIITVVVFWLLVPQTACQLSQYTSDAVAAYAGSAYEYDGPISYDPYSPPAQSCPAVVSRLQQQLIAAYVPVLKDIRYVNIWGYLETGNKGDAAIWSAQQILLSTLGIKTMEVCRFVDKCDMRKFREKLEAHKPYAAIVIAGGGNFNDYYWYDQPAKNKMASMFHDVPIRSFPQSIWMSGRANTTGVTVQAYTAHPNIHLGARDQPSFDWLEKTFGPNENNSYKETGVMRTLTPDIVYMFGNRPDFISTASPKKYDILINSRNDKETSHLNTSILPGDHGTVQLGRHMVRWAKVNWDDTPVPGLNWDQAKGFDERAFLKYEQGFKLHGDAELVVTDKLHGHIISTIIGVPHILLDSKLGKNLAFHNTWTTDCENTRIATDFNQTLDYATMFFEQRYQQGLWKPVEGTS